MKKVSINLDEKSSSWLTRPIRKKEDLILLLMDSMKLLLIGNNCRDEDTHLSITIIIDRMSRIFFISENKLISFNFPFQVEISEDTIIRFYNNNIGQIDNKIISQIISAVNEKSCLEHECIYEFLDALDIEQNKELENNNFWHLFRHLLTFEDGYLRYDFDNSTRMDPTIHPINHIDVFYSNATTFKIGLNGKIDLLMLHEILSHDKKCYFLS